MECSSVQLRRCLASFCCLPRVCPVSWGIQRWLSAFLSWPELT